MPCCYRKWSPLASPTRHWQGGPCRENDEIDEMSCGRLAANRRRLAVDRRQLPINRRNRRQAAMNPTAPRLPMIASLVTDDVWVPCPHFPPYRLGAPILISLRYVDATTSSAAPLPRRALRTPLPNSSPHCLTGKAPDLAGMIRRLTNTIGRAGKRAPKNYHPSVLWVGIAHAGPEAPPCHHHSSGPPEGVVTGP